MFEPSAIYQNATTGQIAYGWQLNQYAGLSGLGRNFFSTAWHKLTKTNLGRGVLAAGAAVAGAKLGQATGFIPKGSLVDLAKVTPGIIANQATRLGRGVASVAGSVGHAIFGGSTSAPTKLPTGSILGTVAKATVPVAAALFTGGAPQQIGAGTGTPAWAATLKQQAGYQGGSATPRVTLPNTWRAPQATPTPRIVSPSPTPATAPATPASSSNTVPLLLAAGAAALALSS